MEMKEIEKSYGKLKTRKTIGGITGFR